LPIQIHEIFLALYLNNGNCAITALGDFRDGPFNFLRKRGDEEPNPRFGLAGFGVKSIGDK